MIHDTEGFSVQRYQILRVTLTRKLNKRMESPSLRSIIGVWEEVRLKVLMAWKSSGIMGSV